MLKISLFFCFLGIYSLSLYAQDKKLLAELEKSTADTNKVNLLREVGISVIYQNPPLAIPYFKEGIQLAHQLAFEPGLERCYSATSTAYAFNAKYDSARIYIDTAIYYAKRVGDVSRLALVYLNRADAYENLNDYTTALKDCDTAMLYAEQSGNKDRLARIYNIVGDIYEHQQKFELAFNYIEKAHGLYVEMGNAQMTGQSLFDKASLTKKTGNKEEAVKYYYKAIAIADSIRDYQNLSSYYGDLSGMLIDMKRYSEAEQLAHKALHYTKQVGNKRQEAVIHGLFFNLYFQKNDLEKAISSGLASYNILREIKDLDREQGAAFSLAEAYFKAGNSKDAFNFLKISKDLNDSLMKKRFSDETAKLQATFELTQKNKEILLLNKDKELQDQKLSRQRVLFTASVALGILLLGGIILLISRYRLQQRIKEMHLRNQIAADLHDEVGSSLSSIHMLSEMATVHQDAGQKEILHRVSSYTRETMDKMGDIVWMIKPSEKEGISLKERMERFLYEMCNSRQIQCSFEWEGPELSKLNMPQRKAIYLVFKEAVNNALKYAEAKRIDVKLRTESRMVKLIVKDDGKGFDTVNAKKGNGLGNILKRAKELKGNAGINSNPGEGTSINFSIPV